MNHGLQFDGNLWQHVYKSRRVAGVCPVKYCRHPARHKNGPCSKCRNRKWRANNPAKSALMDLRSSAKKRGLGFTLTLEEYNKRDDF